MGSLIRAALLAAMLCAGGPAVAADAGSIESFYRGRTVTIIVGYSVGGGYDVLARVLARHLGRHIPGEPAVIVQKCARRRLAQPACRRYLYVAAPKDGAALGVFARGMAMEPLIGTSNTQFDSRKFAWLGSGTDEVSICATAAGSRVKTWDDFLTIPSTFAGEGSGSDPDIFSIMLRNVFGAKLRLVSGYPGGADMTLAIERGEVDGRCGWTWSSLKQQRPEWVAGHKLNIVVQLAMQSSPELARHTCLITDLAATERQRQIVTLVLSFVQAMGRPLVAPPGTPADRKEALRRAFDAAVADPQFIAGRRRAASTSNPSRVPISIACWRRSTPRRLPSLPRSAPSSRKARSRRPALVGIARVSFYPRHH